MRKALSLVVTIFLVLGGIGAVATSLEDNETKSISVSFTQPAIKDEKDYITINTEEANSFLIEQGRPLLPMYTQVLEFPIGTKIKDVKVEPIATREISISKDIEPSPIAASVGTLKLEKTNTEELTEPYPGTWYDYKISTGLFDRENPVKLTIYIYPVNYNPLENTITWAETIDIDIEYDEAENTVLLNDDYDFLILTADQFYDNLGQLVTHKNNRDVSTIAVKLSEVYSGTYFTAQGRDDAEKVKYFIKNAVEQWGVGYVMLVGNDEEFPARETHIVVSDDDDEVFVSDLYYADVYDGKGAFATWDSNNNGNFAEYNWEEEDDEMDLYPDIAIGRIPANDDNEVDIIVNKIINYENQVPYTKDWFTNLVTAGGDSFMDDDDVFEGEIVNQFVADFMGGFIAKRLWVSNGILGDGSPTGVTSIRDAIEEGCGFVDISGHGNTNIWATHPHKNDKRWLPTPAGGLRSSDVHKLTNGDMLPIVVTGACSVSKYNRDDDCFSYSWLSESQGGGIASFGATGLGWAYVGSYVTSGLVEGMATDTLKAYKENHAIDLGEMWVWGLENYMGHHTINQGVEYKTVIEWQMFGDPTLKIAADSQIPDKPSTPSGPNQGSPGTELTYSATGTDPDDDDISFLFDWGDGEYSGWIGPEDSGDTVEASHTWTERGEYSIRVAIKDIHGTQSEWSDPLPITMPKGKSVQFPVLNKLFERFPILKEILKNLF